MVTFMIIIAGPDLPVSLSGHSMVNLGLGQAILGGKNSGYATKKIYFLTCSQQICYITKLKKELSVSRQDFVTIPIHDDVSGCLLESKVLQGFAIFIPNNVQGSPYLLGQTFESLWLTKLAF